MVATSDRSPAAHSAPTLPRNDHPWTEVIIRWTRDDGIFLRSYPKGDGGPILAHVFKGDLIELSPQYQHRDWVLCRSGHILGWLNTNDVKFLIPRKKEPPTTRKPDLIKRIIGFFKSDQQA